MSLHVPGRSDIQSSVEERGYVNAGVVLGRFLLGFSMVEGLGLALKVQTTCQTSTQQLASSSRLCYVVMSFLKGTLDALGCFTSHLHVYCDQMEMRLDKATGQMEDHPLKAFSHVCNFQAPLLSGATQGVRQRSKTGPNASSCSSIKMPPHERDERLNLRARAV